MGYVNISEYNSESVSDNIASSEVIVTQSLALSSESLLVSKIVKSWLYTDSCPESVCQASWYDTDCCPYLASSDSVSLLVYSRGGGVTQTASAAAVTNIAWTQQLDFPLTGSVEAFGNVSNVTALEVTDVQMYFTGDTSFFTSVSWIERKSTVINGAVDTDGDDDDTEAEDVSRYSVYSQMFFGTLTAVEEGGDGDGEKEEDEYVLMASWEDVSTTAMVQQSTESHVGGSVAVQGDWAVQGFCNSSRVAPSAGVVFFYVNSQIEDSTQSAEKEWSLMQILYPTSTDEDDEFNTVEGAHFGSAVALQTNFLAVGAQGLDRVFMYVHNQTVWQIHSVLSASDSTSGSMFGYSLRLLNSNQLVVGSPLSFDSKGIQSGAVFKYAYVRDLDEWAEVNKVEALNSTAGSCFGSSIVAIEDHLFLVTASPSLLMQYGDSDVDSSDYPTRIFSLNFTDCVTYTTCTDAFYNETSNITTPELCISYSTCSGDDSADMGSDHHNSSHLVFFLVFVGAAVLLLPAMVLGVTMFQQRLRLRNENNEYSTDNISNAQAAPVLSMTPLEIVEEGGARGGSVGESPVGRPPLADGAKKGRGSKSYSALTSQAHVETASPLAPQQLKLQQQQQDSDAHTSSSTVGGLLSRLRSMGGSAVPPQEKVEGGVDGGGKRYQDKQPSKDGTRVQLSDLNSPGGPPRLPICQTRSPFVMPAVEE
jgi:hypothetical protein